jgi:hypothetical protein
MTVARLAGRAAGGSTSLGGYFLDPRAGSGLTAARIRRGFRNIRAKVYCPAGASEPGKPGPGRPPGAKNRYPASRRDVGETTKRELTLEAASRPRHRVRRQDRFG